MKGVTQSVKQSADQQACEMDKILYRNRTEYVKRHLVESQVPWSCIM